MKKIGMVPLILLIALSSAFGQWTKNLTFSVSGGMAVPHESFLLNDFFKNDPIGSQFGPVTATNFKENWKNGTNINSRLQYHFSRFLSGQFGVYYSQFQFDKTRLENQLVSFFKRNQIQYDVASLDTYRGTASALSVLLSGRATLPGHLLAPFVTGGAGYLHMNREPIEITSLGDPISLSFSGYIPGEKSDSFLAMAGGGLMLNLSKNVKPFVEVNYLLGTTSGQNTVFYTYQFGFVFGIQK